jgi:hypothetical protein
VPSVQELSGPTGAVILLVAIVTTLVAVIGAFVRDHLRADRDDRKRANDNYLLARDAVDGIKRLADVAERREKRDATRESLRRRSNQ